MAIVHFALRNKTRLAALRVKDFSKREVMVIHTLLWPDEIRDPDFPVLDKKVEVKPAELKMAGQVVESMADDFHPDRYHDDYQEQLQELVQAKFEGGEAFTPEEQPKELDETEDVSDLLAKLEASVKPGLATARRRRKRRPPRRLPRKRPRPRRPRLRRLPQKRLPLRRPPRSRETRSVNTCPRVSSECSAADPGRVQEELDMGRIHTAAAGLAIAASAAMYGLIGAAPAAHADPPICGSPDRPCAGPSPLTPRTAVCVDRISYDDALQLAGPAGAPGHPRKLGLMRNMLAR